MQSFKHKYNRQNCLIRQEIQNFFEKIKDKVVQAKDLSKFYKYVNLHSNSNKDIPPLISNNGEIFDDTEKATSFNEYFWSVFTKDNMQIPVEESWETTPTNRIYNVQLSPDMVYDFLKVLNNSTSVGPDNIPNIVLKNVV